MMMTTCLKNKYPVDFLLHITIFHPIFINNIRTFKSYDHYFFTFSGIYEIKKIIKLAQSEREEKRPQFSFTRSDTGLELNTRIRSSVCERKPIVLQDVESHVHMHFFKVLHYCILYAATTKISLLSTGEM